MRLRRSATRIHRDNTLRLSCGNGTITFVHPCKESPALLLEAVFIAMMFPRFLASTMRSPPVPPPRPPHAHRRIRIEQDRKISLQISTKNAMQLKHSLAAQLATSSLISLRGISEAIAQHNLPMIKRRLDHLRNVLRARSKHQRHLCEWRESLGGRVKQDPPNLLARSRSSRLARFHHLMPRRAQSSRQLAHLRALAGSVQPFERNKFPAPRHRGDDSSAGAPLYELPVPPSHALLESKILQRVRSGYRTNGGPYK